MQQGSIATISKRTSSLLTGLTLDCSQRYSWPLSCYTKTMFHWCAWLVWLLYIVLYETGYCDSPKPTYTALDSVDEFVPWERYRLYGVLAGSPCIAPCLYMVFQTHLSTLISSFGFATGRHFTSNVTPSRRKAEETQVRMSEEAGDVLWVQADGRGNISLKWELVPSVLY
jgi:hypothetical protein